MPKETYTVTVNRPKGVSVADMKNYIDDALNNWWGQLRPPGGYGPDDDGDPLWGLKFEQIKRVTKGGTLPEIVET